MPDENKTKENAPRFPNGRAMLLHFLRGSKRYFFASMLSALLIAVFELINPRIVGFTVDSILGDARPDVPYVLEEIFTRSGGTAYLRTHLWVVALLILFFALLDALCRIVFRIADSKGAETLVKTMRDDLYSHIIRLPFAWHGAHATGDIIQRCTSDVETIKQFLSEHLVTLIRHVALITLALVFMFRVNTFLAGVALVFIPVIVCNALYFHFKIGALFEEVDMEEGKLSAITQENLTGVRVVRAFGKELHERRRFEKQNAVYAGKDMHLSKVFCIYWSIGDFLSRFQGMLIVVLGILLCVRGVLTTGRFIEFVAYNMMMVWPVRMLGRIISEMSKASVSIDRIRYLMNAEEERDPADALTAFPDGDIVFDHVTFSYGDTGEALRDVSFTLRKGETLGILGATGSGKSTLMYLLEHLYELSDGCGSITCGGVDIRNIRRQVLRSGVGMVLQEPYLFSRTIARNIAVTSERKDLRSIRHAARTAALEQTIDAFADGFDTMVGERGVTLSGGQKQRTAIAQMLLRKPKVMVFDDSLSAVDTETDRLIRTALKTETKDATCVLISHRIMTLMEADRIIVLDKGRIVEEGTHESLMERGGLYRTIHDLQMKGAVA